MVIVWLAACSYTPPDPAATTPGDSPTSTGDAPSDTAPDVTLVSECTVGTDSSPTVAGFVGGTGGGTSTNLVCPANQLPIGVEFELINTTGAQFNNQRVLTTIHVRCGTVSRTTTNLMISTPAERLTRAGICGNDDTATGEQLCPAGAVLVAIRGNASGGNASSLNSVQMDCAAVLPDGSVESAVTTLDFRPTTGDFSNSFKNVACPPNTAITVFGGKEGCSLDSISISCASLTCQ